MQNGVTTTAEQVFPWGIVLTVVLVVAVAGALIWWAKKTRGGRTPPKGS
ncbi:MAG TPA: hypothetical protein VFO52_04280 [Longimicrobiales bacterium]|nr:hypothetical protein [Longimicrobiales bacterium]